MLVANYGPDTPLIPEFNGNYETGIDLYNSRPIVTVTGSSYNNVSAPAVPNGAYGAGSPATPIVSSPPVPAATIPVSSAPSVPYSETPTPAATTGYSGGIPSPAYPTNVPSPLPATGGGYAASAAPVPHYASAGPALYHARVAGKYKATRCKK
ncbi:hypothetical protein LPJ71_001721 [Coemansia sp. S17]|nr:hypothetical protein LPJ71_001721 [Coemansia sp. S17]